MGNRRENYTQYQKELLVNLMGKRPILFNKGTDRLISEVKARAWQEIADIFSRDPRARQITDWKKLRSTYKNLKAKAGKEIAAARWELTRLTGCGQNKGVGTKVLVYFISIRLHRDVIGTPIYNLTGIGC